jgi:hypothetical protein
LRHRPDQDSLYRRPSLYPSAVIKGKITLDKVIVIAKFTRDIFDTDSKLTTLFPALPLVEVHRLDRWVTVVRGHRKKSNDLILLQLTFLRPALLQLRVESKKPTMMIKGKINIH